MTRIWIALLAALAACASTPAESPFFAMDTALTPRIGKTTADVLGRVAWVNELGLDGLSWRVEGLDDLLVRARAEGVRVHAVYANLSIDGELPAALTDIFPRLQASGAALWLTLRSEQHERSSTAGDGAAVRRLRELAGLARDAGVRIVLYHHTGFWAERFDDVVRIARATNDPLVGATFNLCHWLRVEGDADPTGALGAAGPLLAIVTINGADVGGREWNELIRPLDEGTYDVAGLLATLRELGFEGPIGLQGYGLRGAPRENLERSARAWSTLRSR